MMGNWILYSLKGIIRFSGSSGIGSSITIKRVNILASASTWWKCAANTLGQGRRGFLLKLERKCYMNVASLITL